MINNCIDLTNQDNHTICYMSNDGWLEIYPINGYQYLHIITEVLSSLVFDPDCFFRIA